MRNPEWKHMTGADRGRLLYKLADLIGENRKLLATVDAWDAGKAFFEAFEGDIPEAEAVIRNHAGYADKITGQTIPVSSKKLAYTIRQPIGVVSQIIPWNYPTSMIAWKVGPALACGNAVVLKAAEQTPLGLLVFADLVRQAGFPPGTVNLINGLGREAGPAMVSHPLVDKVAFTGSTETARAIMASAAKTLKNVTFETGGKSPLLVFDDADMEQAVRWSHMGINSNSGQICTATSRILVQESVYDRFVEEFVERVKTVSKVGNQWDKDTYQGPQVSKVQHEKVLEYINIGKGEARLAHGGGALDLGDGKGFYVKPTVFADVKPTTRIWKEEIFGPVVAIAPFKTEEEAIALANDSLFGLGASVFTTDLERAHRVAGEVESGTVWINSSQDCDPLVPFGGVKQSGIGRELGDVGLDAYTQVKAVHINMGSKL